MANQVDIKALYEQDFYQWLLTTADLLKSRQLTQIDWENLIEEVEGLAREEIRQLHEHLEEIFRYLLMFQYELIDLENREEVESHRSKLSFSRIQLETLLKSSSSLEQFWDKKFELAYQDAKKMLSIYFDISKITFPDHPPLTREQVFDYGYLPCLLP